MSCSRSGCCHLRWRWRKGAKGRAQAVATIAAPAASGCAQSEVVFGPSPLFNDPPCTLVLSPYFAARGGDYIFLTRGWAPDKAPKLRGEHRCERVFHSSPALSDLYECLRQRAATPLEIGFGTLSSTYPRITYPRQSLTRDGHRRAGSLRRLEQPVNAESDRHARPWSVG